MNLSIYMMYIFSFIIVIFSASQEGRGVFWAWFLPISSICSRLSRVFLQGFFLASECCRYVSKTPLIFLDVFCDEFFTILFFRLLWSSIKRSGLLRHNKPEIRNQKLVVICVLLGSLLLRTEVSHSDCLFVCKLKTNSRTLLGYNYSYSVLFQITEE